MANSFLRVGVKGGVALLNVESIVSITEETDDDSTILQMVTGQTINATDSIGELIGSLRASIIFPHPIEDDEDAETTEDSED